MKLDVSEKASLLSSVLKPLEYGKKALEPLKGIGERPPLDSLKRGEIEVLVKDIEHDPEGRAVFAGKKVLLYIKDQGPSIGKVLAGSYEAGKKVHLRRCQKVKELAENGRADRYSVIIRDDGFFPVVNMQYGHTSEEVPGRLRVCFLCLNELNIRNLPSNQSRMPSALRSIFKKGPRANEKDAAGFNYKAFLDGSLDVNELYGMSYDKPDLEKYPLGNIKNSDIDGPSVVIRPTPILIHSSKENDEDDWASISQKIRADRLWTCECCGVDLSENRGLLHCHHRNGNKDDNRTDNIKVLCSICHSEEPLHEWMHVKSEDRKVIEVIRSVQSSETLASPSVIDESLPEWAKSSTETFHQSAVLLSNSGLEPESIGEDFIGQDGAVSFEMEFAWPSLKIGIVGDNVNAPDCDWTIIRNSDLSDQLAELSALIRRE